MIHKTHSYVMIWFHASILLRFTPAEMRYAIPSIQECSCFAVAPLYQLQAENNCTSPHPTTANPGHFPPLQVHQLL